MGDSRRQWIFVAAFVAVLAALVGVGWQYRKDFLPMEVGSPAPDFPAHDLQGRKVTLAQLRGQVVLLNIWATWCEPCRQEMPSMERLHRQLGPEGLRIVAVSIDASPSTADDSGRRGGDVAAFVREFGITFPVWRDPAGDVQQLYRTTGVPESFVISRDGTIMKKVIGATEWDTPDKVELVRRLLKE
jgi:cytochrome c biogenesis protein CcmG/thiol:disulfide interchange protein DsbE